MSDILRSFLIILVSTIFVNNFVLAKVLGICPFLGVSKKLDSAIGMSLAVIFVMGLASAVTWPIQTYILMDASGSGRWDYSYLQTIVFILVIAALVQLVEIAMKKLVPALHRGLGVYLPLITTNCAVLGVTMLNFEQELGYVESIFNGIGAGIGFMLAMVLFAGVRSRMESCTVSKSFEGVPITLVAASITALAFMGFSGVVEGLFGV
jgi:electron transport complex protein RnfA